MADREAGKSLLVEKRSRGAGDREVGHIFHDSLSDIMNERTAVDWRFESSTRSILIIDSFIYFVMRR